MTISVRALGRGLAEFLIALLKTFRGIENFFIRLLRVFLSVIYPPVLVVGAGFLGYLYGPELLPRVLLLSQGSIFREVSPALWEKALRWTAVITLAFSGYITYLFHRELAQLRSTAEYAYSRYRQVYSLPGSRITDFLWALFRAICLVYLSLGFTVFCIIGVPFLVTQNWLFRVLLICFLGARPSTYYRAVSSVLKRSFSPLRLQWIVKHTGEITPRLEIKLQEYIKRQDRRERAQTIDREVQRNDW